MGYGKWQTGAGFRQQKFVVSDGWWVGLVFDYKFNIGADRGYYDEMIGSSDRLFPITGNTVIHMFWSKRVPAGFGRAEPKAIVIEER